MAMAAKTKNEQSIDKKSHRGLAPRIRRMKARNPNVGNTEIARRVGCTEGNVRAVLRTFLRGTTEPELAEFQQDKANILDVIQLQTLRSITPKKLAKASASALATTYGILHDKAALLRGQATSINLTALLDVVEAIRARDK